MPLKCPRILIATITGWWRNCARDYWKQNSVVGIVNNGRDMVRAAAKLKPDAIVVDIAMPILNGLDATQR